MNTEFITLLAWIFGVGSTLLVALRIWTGATYTLREKMLDQLQGQVATFPIMKPAILAVVCWAWLLTH